MLLPVAFAGDAAAGEHELCRFDRTYLPEISGLAASAIHPGIVWAHNDSGARPRLYALDTGTCEIRAVITVQGVAAVDPEAIAAGTNSAGEPVLWWGDIGDNTARRRSVAIHEIPEPAQLADAVVDPVTYRIRLRNPEDAEALMADHDHLWMIGKGLAAGTLWELPHPLRPNGISRATAVGAEEGLVTDAAMRPGGGYAVRDYTEVRIYSGAPPGKLVTRIPLVSQVQGEAMTWTQDGTSLILASEGDDRLLLLPVTADPGQKSTASAPRIKQASSGRNAPATPTAMTVLEPVDRVGSLAVGALGIAAVVFIASTAFVIGVVRGRRPD